MYRHIYYVSGSNKKLPLACNHGCKHGQTFKQNIHLVNYDPVYRKIDDKAAYTSGQGYPVIDKSLPQRLPIKTEAALSSAKNQDGEGEIAKLTASKQLFTNQQMTSQRLRPLLLYSLWYAYSQGHTESICSTTPLLTYPFSSPLDISTVTN